MAWASPAQREGATQWCPSLGICHGQLAPLLSKQVEEILRGLFGGPLRPCEGRQPVACSGHVY